MKKRQMANLLFGWWLMIPLALTIMLRYRIRAFDKYKPKLAKEFTRTFGLGVNFPERY